MIDLSIKISTEKLEVKLFKNIQHFSKLLTKNFFDFNKNGELGFSHLTQTPYFFFSNFGQF